MSPSDKPKSFEQGISLIRLVAFLVSGCLLVVAAVITLVTLFGWLGVAGALVLASIFILVTTIAVTRRLERINAEMQSGGTDS